MLDTEGRASAVRTWSVALGATFIVALVLYGLSHPPSGAKTEDTASIPSAVPTSSASPPAGQQNQQAQSQPKNNAAQTTGSGAGSNAPPPNPPKAQERVNQPPANGSLPAQQPPANAGAQSGQTR
jgi:hypothetical protein